MRVLRFALGVLAGLCLIGAAVLFFLAWPLVSKQPLHLNRWFTEKQ